MSGLKEVRTRIQSVGSTMKITSAMKMVSAAKLKKSQDRITETSPYSYKLQELISNICSENAGSFSNPFAEQKEVKNILVVAITSNRGLCGAFNSSIIKKVKQLVSGEYSNYSVDILPIGKKGAELLASTTTNLEDKNHLFDNLTFDAVAEVADQLNGYFIEGKYDKIMVIYNHFINAASQKVITEQYLPITLPESEGSTSLEYKYEPSKEEILSTLIPKALRTQLYKAILDSNASENGARMTAMHKATDNAKNLQSELKLIYNKARQAAITKEILEIVGGAEALNG